jgi:ketosteroid isomerase-like protein
MTPEAETITTFYDCFSRRDAEGMVALYADDVVFHDPAFGELRGERAKNMWRMLCEAGKDLEVTATGISGDHGAGRAHWEADYTFSTGRKVHNVVTARFDLRDGLITRHEDDFSFAAWSRQAFGPPGMLGRLLGAATTFQLLSNRQLDSYIAKRDSTSQG